MTYIQKTIELLSEKGYTISFAESCTGGMIASSLVDVSGASSVFGYGFITYSADAKISILGVNSDTIKSHGIVSCEVAKEMALGASERSNSNVSISVTGCAGPGKDDDGNEPGTICFGFYICGNVFAEKVLLDGNSRNEIRAAAVEYAYKRIVHFLSN
jgi:PncC family amidohydrolase